MTLQIWIFQEDLMTLSKLLKDSMMDEETTSIEYTTTPTTTDQICVTLTIDELTLLLDRDVLTLIQTI